MENLQLIEQKRAKAALDDIYKKRNTAGEHIRVNGLETFKYFEAKFPSQLIEVVIENLK